MSLLSRACLTLRLQRVSALFFDVSACAVLCDATPASRRLTGESEGTTVWGTSTSRVHEAKPQKVRLCCPPRCFGPTSQWMPFAAQSTPPAKLTTTAPGIWCSRLACRRVASARRRGPPVGRDLVLVDQIGGGEDEDLAHHVGVLLVAAHEADHRPAGRHQQDPPPQSRRYGPLRRDPRQRPPRTAPRQSQSHQTRRSSHHLASGQDCSRLKHPPGAGRRPATQRTAAHTPAPRLRLGTTRLPWGAEAANPRDRRHAQATPGLESPIGNVATGRVACESGKHI